MISKSSKFTQILIISLLTIAGSLIIDSLFDNTREACADSADTGCAEPGATPSTLAGFSPEDVNLSNNLEINNDSHVSLDQKDPDMNNIQVNSDQEVFVTFFYEKAGDVSSLGWYSVDMVRACYKAKFGKDIDAAAAEIAPGGLPDSTVGIPFADFLAAHDYCVNTGYTDADGNNIKGEMLKWLFPYVQDGRYSGGSYITDGVMDYNVHPNSVSYGGSRLGMTRGSAPTDEDDYKEKSGMAIVDDDLLNVKDSRQSLGDISAGTEIGFIILGDRYLSLPYYSKYKWYPMGYSNPAKKYTDHYDVERVYRSGSYRHMSNIAGERCYSSDMGGTDRCDFKEIVFGLKTGVGNEDKCRNPSQTLIRRFLLDKPAPGGCKDVDWKIGTQPPTWDQGLMDEGAITRLEDYWPALNFSGQKSMPHTFVWDTVYNHFVIVSPQNDRHRWIFGIEDLEQAGDADFNDAMFIMKLKNDGAAELKTAVGPDDEDAFISTVKIKVRDTLPDDPAGCDGKTDIKYYISVDNGVIWSEVDTWSIVRDNNENGPINNSWAQGDSGTTYRETTIDFMGTDTVGRQLKWKAEFITEDDRCAPKMERIDLSYNALNNTTVSRSAPAVLVNRIYNSFYETPDINWKDLEVRGHLTSKEIYDPVNSENADPDAAATVGFWDAGDELNGVSPTSRKVWTPELNTTSVVAEQIATGDGITTTFKTTLKNFPVVFSSLVITDTIEEFVDKGSSNLVGSVTGTGTIDRFNGIVEFTFKDPPGNGANITATYNYYSYVADGADHSKVIDFKDASIDHNSMGMDDTSSTDGGGKVHYKYDADGDGAFSSTDDIDYLKYWVLGFRDGNKAGSVEKEWKLAAIDHSSPALLGAPGIPSFYFGKSYSDADRLTYDKFRCEQRKRDTVAFAGSRMGMLHAFYAGKYRPYHVDESIIDGSAVNCTSKQGLKELDEERINQTTDTNAAGNKVPVYPAKKLADGERIIINRGYYEWTSDGGVDIDKGNYGTGEELFAFIPSDQIPRLKNNLLSNTDKAFVDASPTVANVQFDDTTWHSVVISAEGEGGNHVFALDVTELDNPKVLWEFSDPELYRSRSAPSMGVVGRIAGEAGNDIWAVFFVSGIKEGFTGDPSIYMLNVQSGKLIKKIVLDAANGNDDGGTPSGQPALMDSDGNGFVDRLYVGTDGGFMYKVNLPNDYAAGENIEACSAVFYEAKGGSSEGGERQSIYASPSLMNRNEVNKNGGIDYTTIVLFGTSGNPYHDDAAAKENIRYKFFAVKDTDAPGECNAGELVKSFELPAGQQIFASAFSSANKAYFGTTTKLTEDPCSANIDTSGSSGGGGSSDDSIGGLFALDLADLESPIPDPTKIIDGNFDTAPIVDDEHLYVDDGTGNAKAIGDREFQNQKNMSGTAELSISNWREINE